MNLKPCPFCAAIDQREHIELRRGIVFAVLECTNCYATMASAVGGSERDKGLTYSAMTSSFAELRQRWNARVEPMEREKPKRKKAAR